LAIKQAHPPLMPLSIFANRNRSGAYEIRLTVGTSTFAVK
jgi:hypothetical protein